MNLEQKELILNKTKQGPASVKHMRPDYFQGN